MIRLNRKGQMDDAGLFPVLIIGSIAVYFIMSFFLNSALASYDAGSIRNVESSQIENFIPSFLSSHVEFEGKKMTMYNVIQLWGEDKERYSDALSRSSVDILNKYDVNFYGVGGRFEKPGDVVRGHDIVIRSLDENNEPGPIIFQAQSRSFVPSFCPRIPCRDVGGTRITTSNGDIYIAFRYSVVGKEFLENE